MEKHQKNRIGVNLQSFTYEIKYCYLKRFPIIVKEKLGYRVRKTLGQKGPGDID